MRGRGFVEKIGVTELVPSHIKSHTSQLLPLERTLASSLTAVPLKNAYADTNTLSPLSNLRSQYLEYHNTKIQDIHLQPTYITQPPLSPTSAKPRNSDSAQTNTRNYTDSTPLRNGGPAACENEASANRKKTQVKTSHSTRT